VLKTLGVVDYGIYNVVGGVVTMFSFLSGAMASASQRFFSFELGRKDYTRLKQTFSLTFTIYIGIAVLILLLAESVGLWFLNTQMTIPSNRMDAANWVYQFSVLSFMMTVLTIPYNAAIIAREKMKVYAYVSIVDAVLKLLIVYLLVLFAFDKLKLYAVLTFIVTTIITFIYRTYCKRKFEECAYSFYWDKKMMSALFSYSGWNMIGASANIFRKQGINILLNVFYGPVINVACAVSFQIYAALTQFTTNLYSSTRPQITKYYAQNETESMWRLVFDSTKISYYLFMILSIPFFLEVEYIFTLWLGNVPEYATLITRLVLAEFMLEAMSNMLVVALQAANKIKKLQIISVPILFLNLPVSFILLRLGGSPYIPFIVSIIITILYIISQMLIVKKDMGLHVRPYLKKNTKLVLVTFLSVIFPYFLHTIINFGVIRFVTILITSLLSSGIFIWFIDIDRSEKNAISVFAKQFSNWQYAKNRKI
jgi:O-antigen/teichoic acid export membrane protein